MEILAGALLIGGGYFLNSQDKTLRMKGGAEKIVQVEKPTEVEIKSSIPNETKKTTVSSLPQTDEGKIKRVFRLHFHKDKDITNPEFREDIVYGALNPTIINQIKTQVDLNKVNVDKNLNDVGFKSSNAIVYDNGNTYQSLPSIDDIERDVQLTHNNMVPFFGGRIKQNVNETGAQAAILENYTGNYRHTRRDNKQEVQYLFDPSPNIGNVNGSSTEMVTNRDRTRIVPSVLGKRNNETPFEKINVGRGVGNGYTAKPSGGFHQDVRILPKTTEELMVNPRITYEGRVKAGKAVTEKGTLMGEQIIKKPKAIMVNLNGERNFTTTGAHLKNKQRPDIILRTTNRDKLHGEYTGIAAPTTKDSNTPNALRGQKKVSTNRNFMNTPFRNLIQAVGKKINDFSKSGIWNKPTERSEQSTRVHYTNVHQVGGTRGQQYLSDETKYTRKQDLISNRSGGIDANGMGICDLGKAGPMGRKAGKVYDPNDTAKITIRETTEDNQSMGNMSRASLHGPVYDQTSVARTTIKETTIDNKHAGFIGDHKRAGKVYDQNDVAKTTIRETMEDNEHMGHMQKKQYRGKAYDQSDVARTTIKETTVGSGTNMGWVGKHADAGKVYDPNDVAKTTIKETTLEPANEYGFMAKHKQKGKVYDETDVAKTTIRETTSENKYTPSINSGVLQDGGGYKTTNPNSERVPQRLTTSDHDYIGIAEASTNKKQMMYESGYNRINVNKELIALGRAPTASKNYVNIGKNDVHIQVNKLESDQEIPYVQVKGTDIGNMYNPEIVLTSKKNVPFRQVDRLQTDVMNQVRFNPLQINQTIN